jgi:hypothetical protein
MLVKDEKQLDNPNIIAIMAKIFSESVREGNLENKKK